METYRWPNGGWGLLRNLPNRGAGFTLIWSLQGRPQAGLEYQKELFRACVTRNSLDKRNIFIKFWSWIFLDDLPDGPALKAALHFPARLWFIQTFFQPYPRVILKDIQQNTAQAAK